MKEEIKNILSQNKSAFETKDFMTFWGDGYIETFGNYPEGSENSIYENCIKPFTGKNKKCLEIGCGGGLWTNKYLLGNFDELTCIDVIPKSKNITSEKISYFQLANKDYTCSPVKTECMDFVWCFGVFCHLPNSAVNEYIKNIKRILKTNGEAVVMFGNWNKFKLFKNIENGSDYMEKAHKIGWFYMDDATIRSTLNNSGITHYKELMPEFRDSIIYGSFLNQEGSNNTIL